MNESLFVSPSAHLPRVDNPERAALGLDKWREHASALDDTSLRKFACDLVEDPTGRRLLEAIFSNSPFLSRCALDDIGFVRQLLTRGPEHVLGQILDRLKEELARESNRERLMQELRVARRQVALLVAVADLTDHWVLERVTESLSDFADGALSAVVSHLMIQAAARGDIAPVDSDSAEEDCGYVILAMGKHGARELNYSSDIALLVRTSVPASSGERCCHVLHPTPMGVMAFQIPVDL